jgi:hypothetical protein
MKNGRAGSWIGIGLAGFSAALAPGLPAQGQAVPRPALLTVAAEPADLPGALVRMIDDPHTGARWLLLRDLRHPGGPGRLVLAAPARKELRPKPPPAAEMARPVIRAGDRLIVEEETAVVAARLEAVALGPAGMGAPFEARLGIGGRVVRVLALAPGRAALQPETGARR